jgi:hypothetical protein
LKNFNTPPKHSNKVSDVIFCTPNGHTMTRHRRTTGVRQRRSDFGRVGREDKKARTMGAIGMRLSRGVSQVFGGRDLGVWTPGPVVDIISASRAQ